MTDDQFFIDNELRIPCADAIELVTDYLEDALNELDRENLAVHLGLCEGCRVFLDQIRGTIRIVAATQDQTVELRPRNFQSLLDMFAEGSDPAS